MISFLHSVLSSLVITLFLNKFYKVSKMIEKVQDLLSSIILLDVINLIIYSLLKIKFMDIENKVV